MFLPIRSPCEGKQGGYGTPVFFLKGPGNSERQPAIISLGSGVAFACPFLLAWRRLLNLPDPDAYRVLRSNRTMGENTGKNKMKPHLHPGFPFMFSW